MKYSNPRMMAVIEDWPLGSNKRGPAHFIIERDKRGERAVRTTNGAPKKLTYGIKQRIVDGDDGRTYIAVLHEGIIQIMRGDMKLQQEAVFPRDPRYAEIEALFKEDK